MMIIYSSRGHTALPPLIPMDATSLHLDGNNLGNVLLRQVLLNITRFCHFLGQPGTGQATLSELSDHIFVSAFVKAILSKFENHMIFVVFISFPTLRFFVARLVQICEIISFWPLIIFLIVGLSFLRKASSSSLETGWDGSGNLTDIVHSTFSLLLLLIRSIVIQLPSSWSWYWSSWSCSLLRHSLGERKLNLFSSTPLFSQLLALAHLQVADYDHHDYDESWWWWSWW